MDNPAVDFFELPPTVTFLTLVALAGLAAWLVAAVIIWLLTHTLWRGRMHAGHVRRMRRPLWLLFWALAATAIAAAPAVESPYAKMTAALLGIASGGALLVSLIRILSRISVASYRLDVADNLAARKRHTQVRLLRRAGITLVVVLTLGAMLMVIPGVRQVGASLVASAGVAGLIIGLAAQPVIRNLIAGVQLALTQPIRLDDVVIVEGEWGWIEEITSTFVVVRIWDWRRLIVPLSHFIEKPFQNWTRRSASIIGAVTWQMDYSVPVAELRERLREWLEASELWDRDVANLQVTDAGERTITVRALMSARSSPQAWDLRCAIREKMIAYLARHHPGSLPTLRARLDDPPQAQEPKEAS